jgi:tRNA1(Val) A37 N6-methylase TrmN6
LGSGDGRIAIMAVQKFNAARAIGIDINPDRIRDAEANLKAAGVSDRARFLNEDLFEANISKAAGNPNRFARLRHGELETSADGKLRCCLTMESR